MLESLLRGRVGPCPLYRISERLQKHIAFERFCLELDGACFHGLHRHGNITVARYKYDRHSRVLDGYPLL